MFRCSFLTYSGSHDAVCASQHGSFFFSFFSVPFAKNSLLFIPEGRVFSQNAQNSFNFKTLHIPTTCFKRQQPGKPFFLMEPKPIVELYTF